jgi:hypothetical protein
MAGWSRLEQPLPGAWHAPQRLNLNLLPLPCSLPAPGLESAAAAQGAGGDAVASALSDNGAGSVIQCVSGEEGPSRRGRGRARDRGGDQRGREEGRGGGDGSHGEGRGGQGRGDDRGGGN